VEKIISNIDIPSNWGSNTDPSTNHWSPASFCQSLSRPLFVRYWIRAGLTPDNWRIRNRKIAISGSVIR